MPTQTTKKVSFSGNLTEGNDEDVVETPLRMLWKIIRFDSYLFLSSLTSCSFSTDFYISLLRSSLKPVILSPTLRFLIPLTTKSFSLEKRRTDSWFFSSEPEDIVLSFPCCLPLFISDSWMCLNSLFFTSLQCNLKCMLNSFDIREAESHILLRKLKREVKSVVTQKHCMKVLGKESLTNSRIGRHRRTIALECLRLIFIDCRCSDGKSRENL